MKKKQIFWELFILGFIILFLSVSWYYYNFYGKLIVSGILVPGEEATISQLKDNQDKQIKKICFYSSDANSLLQSTKYDWEAVSKEDVEFIRNSLIQGKGNGTLTKGTEKIVIFYKDNSLVWFYFLLNRKEQEVYGTDYRSKRLWDILSEKGVIKPLKISPLPKLHEIAEPNKLKE